MPKYYRVFTFDPLARGDNRPTSWRTVSTQDGTLLLPPATIEKAAQRISLIYQNVIFQDDGEEQDDSHKYSNVIADPTIDWPPTNPMDDSTRLLHATIDDSRFQETFQTDQTGDGSTMLSEGSSISRFPAFTFSLSAVSSLSSVPNFPKPSGPSSKATLLLGVLEAEGLNYVTIKTGPQAGSDVGLLKLIVGDEHGIVCKIVAWRETAETWGGANNEPTLKRGDIVLFENVIVSFPLSQQENHHDSSSKAQLTASPNLKSSAQICYRTLPHIHEDRKWRPDLRLAGSVPVVRKVVELVTWMERMAGIRAQA